MNRNNSPDDLELLRQPEVSRLTKLTRSGLRSLEARGLFPVAIRAGRKFTAWRRSDIAAWIEREAQKARRARR